MLNEFEKFSSLKPKEKNTSVDRKEKGMDSEAKSEQKLRGLDVGSL